MATVRITLESGVPIVLRNPFIVGNGVAGTLASGTVYWLNDATIRRIETVGGVK